MRLKAPSHRGRVRPPRRSATSGSSRPSAPPAPGAPWPAWPPSRPRPPAPATEPGTVLGWIAYVGGLGSAVSALALALDTQGATFAGLGVVLALLVGVAVLGEGARRVVAACGAVLTATGLVFAVAAARGFEDHWTALALLLVPAATAVIGAKARPVALPVEITGAAVALLGVRARRVPARVPRARAGPRRSARGGDGRAPRAAPVRLVDGGGAVPAGHLGPARGVGGDDPGGVHAAA